MNGKIYDVTTGTLVKKLTPKNSPKTPAAKPAAASLDGFVTPKKAPKKAVAPAAKTAVAKPATKARQHNPTKHLKHHRPQRANTLMRGAVSKPQPAARPEVSKAHGPAQAVSVVKQNTEDRLKRSAIVHKSKSIHKFKSPAAGQLIKRTEPLAVKKPDTQKPIATQTTRTAAAPSPAASKPAASENIFTEAIKKATSHELPRLKKSQVKSNRKKRSKSKRLGLLHSRWAKIVVISIIVLSVLGVLAWNYLPHLEIRVASLRAGFTATLPDYKPSGFGIEDFDYKRGQVSIVYQSNSDQRSFTITQKTSNWNSETLLASFLTPSGQSYQTYQEQGRTIYIYNGTNATWVDGGIWYRIEGNSSLSNEQLLRIANSF